MVLITVLFVWLVVAGFCFWTCRVDLADSGQSIGADLVCSLLFWWIVLPFLAAFAGAKLGRHYGAQLIAWQKRRNAPQRLRAGAENGLYE